MPNSIRSTGILGYSKCSTSQGVKQGGGSSCNSFTAYIDPTIDAVNSYGEDGWLENLHIYLLMDDIVIFATSCEALCAKLQLLKQSADSIGMTLHPSKSKYLIANTEDKTTIPLHDVEISHTEKYMYLGTLITNQPISAQVKKKHMWENCIHSSRKIQTAHVQ